MTHRTTLKNRLKKLLLLGLASTATWQLSTFQTNQAFGQSTQESRQQSSVIVLSDKDANSEKLLNELREKLKFLPEDKRNEILEQVEKSLRQINKPDLKEQRVVVATVDAQGKNVEKDGNVVTMTIVQSEDDKGENRRGEKRASVRARVEKLQNLPNATDLTKELKQLLPKNFGENMVIQGAQILANDEAPKFRIGLSVQTPDEGSEANEQSDSNGLVIERVMEDSPAAEAGIQEGDIILAINGQDAKNFKSLQEAVQEAGKEDRALKLKLQRDGKEWTLKVKPTKSEETATMTLQLMPQAGSILLPTPELNGQGGNAFRIEIPGQATGEASQSRTDKEIAELREEVQELKKMVKQLLEASSKR